jgi:GT2 family glycosyltransferase
MRDFCVCVPARNEVKAIPILLGALAEQTVSGSIRVALCVNNSDDQTAAIAMATADALSPRLDLRCENRVFAPSLAHAGSARLAAMEFGASLLETDDDILISTDADCRPPPNWIEAILAAMDHDRIIGGRIVLDDRESLAPTFIALRERFDQYWADVRAIEDRIDPTAWDPPPRHGDHTGASLALSRGLYRRAGGVPLLASGEDRALVEAAVRVGGRLAHPDTVWTRASARTVGRAAGGMAMDMQRLMRELERGTTPLVPSFDQWRWRAEWRRDTRATLRAGESLPDVERQLEAMPCDMPLPAGA